MRWISLDSKRYQIIFFMLVTFVVYGNTFLNQWTYDDVPVILENPDVHSFGGFLDNARPGRPVRELSYIPEYHLFGDQPAGYRVQQLAWHCANGFLLAVLLNALGLELPFILFGSLFFLVHPLQSESVANISHRKELLALFFSLVALLCYVKSFALSGAKRLLAWGGSLIAYGCALLSNETVVTLPLAVLLYEGVMVEREKRVLLRRPLLTLLVLVSAVTVLVYRYRWLFDSEQLLTVYSKNSFVPSDSYIPLFMGAMKAFGFYVVKTAFPINLAPEYTFRLSESLWQPWALLSIAILGATVLFAVTFRNVLPPVSYGIGWFLVFWLPVSNLVPVAYLAADRYMYLCLPGISIVLAAMLQRYSNRWLIAAVSFVLVVFAGLTVIQNSYWRDEHTLWRHAARVNPDSTWALESAAYSYYLTSDLEVARRYAKRALSVSRTNTKVYLVLAQIEEARGDLTEAIRNYEIFISAGKAQYPELVRNVIMRLPALKERMQIIEESRKRLP